jgi:hypothetical protein
MDDVSGPYSNQIRASIPQKFIQLLPALTTQAAHKATQEAFDKLKQQMIRAGVRSDCVRHGHRICTRNAHMHRTRYHLGRTKRTKLIHRFPGTVKVHVDQLVTQPLIKSSHQ